MSEPFDELDLTAYALGELDAPVRERIDEHLQRNPGLRREIDEIRGTAEIVAGELLLDSTPGLTDLQHAAIEQRLAEMDPSRIPAIRRNWAMWGSLAASIAIVCTVMASVLPLVYRGRHVQVRGTEGGNGVPGVEPAPDMQPIRPAMSSQPATPLQPLDRFLPGDRPDFLSLSHAPLPMSHGETGFLRVADAPLSSVPTCSAWPDSAENGTLTRLAQTLAAHRLPPADAVRSDQIINALPYSYPAPSPGQPVAVHLEVAGCPWRPDHRLVQIGLRAADHLATARPASTTAPADALALRIDVEFNPAVAGAYRLIGYEQEGETGGEVRYESETPGSGEPAAAGTLAAGHLMTILYEVVPASDVMDTVSPLRDNPLKYQKLDTVSAPAGELVNVTVTYRPAGTVEAPWRRIVRSAVDDGRLFTAASDDFRTSAAAAALALILRDSPFKGGASLEQLTVMVTSLAAGPDGPRKPLLDLIAAARSVTGR